MVPDTLIVNTFKHCSQVATDLLEEACMTLDSITHNNPASQKAFCDAGGFEVVCHAIRMNCDVHDEGDIKVLKVGNNKDLRHHPSRLLDAACDVLSSATRNNAANKHRCASAGGIDAVRSIITCFCGSHRSYELRKKAACALMSME